MAARPNIVLVHGAWADGSCWSSVIERLQADGYHVTAPQFPMTALGRAAVRQPHGRHHHRGPGKPRRHDLPPGRSDPADHGRGRNLRRDSMTGMPASGTP